MSDDLLKYVPVDPTWRPTPETAQRAASLLKTIAPNADAVTWEIWDKVIFVDAGGNWSGVRCPFCRAEVEDWWRNAISEAFASKFENLSVMTPCCNKAVSLSELDYVWPVGFGSFVLSAKNPDLADTMPEQDKLLEACLGTQLRKVRAHI